MRIIDIHGAIDSISIPGFEDALPIGVELPDGLDFEVLGESLKTFYGDRLTLVSVEPELQPEPATRAPQVEKKPRRRK